MINLLLALSLAFASEEGCKVACIRSGYDTGWAYKQGCRCVDNKENYDNFIHNRTDLNGLETYYHEPPTVLLKQSYKSILDD